MPDPIISLPVNVYTARRAAAITHVAAKNGMNAEDYMMKIVEAVGLSWEAEMDRDKLEEIKLRAAKATPEQISQVDQILPPLVDPTPEPTPVEPPADTPTDTPVDQPTDTPTEPAP